MAVPHYMGLNEFVETLSQYLTQRKLRRHYRSHERLLDDVESIVQEFMKERLGPLNLDFAVWRGVAELGTEGIDPVPVFGTDFIPDMVVSVSDSPTLAIHAQLIRGRLNTSDKIGGGYRPGPRLLSEVPGGPHPGTPHRGKRRIQAPAGSRGSDGPVEQSQDQASVSLSPLFLTSPNVLPYTRNGRGQGGRPLVCRAARHGPEWRNGSATDL